MANKIIGRKDAGRNSRDVVPRRFVSLSQQQRQIREGASAKDEAERKKPPTQKRFRLLPTWVEAVSAAVIAVVTIALLLVTCEQRKIADITNKILDRQSEILDRQLITGSRAWVAPIRAEYDAPSELRPNNLMTIKLFIRNPGNEPARKVIHRMNYGTVTVPKNSHDQVWFEEKWRENKTCVPPNSPTRPDEPLMIFHPSGESEPDTIILNTFTGAGLPASFFWPVNLRERSHQTVFVEGCFSYRTAGIDAWSKYCFYAHPETGKRPDKWRLETCQRGNDAN